MEPVKKIIIVGGTPSAMLTASILAIHLKNVDIQLINARSEVAIPLGASLSPNYTSFL